MYQQQSCQPCRIGNWSLGAGCLLCIASSALAGSEAAVTPVPHWGHGRLVINRTPSEPLCHAASSGGETIPGGQVEGLVGGERRGLGLGLSGLLPAEAGARR